MAQFKCKMCGNDLEIAAGMTTTECEHCGTRQTFSEAETIDAIQKDMETNGLINKDTDACNEIYTRAKDAMAAAKTEAAYKQAAQQFETISDYQDAAALAEECYEKAEIARKDAILTDGKNHMRNNRVERVSDYEAAIKEFEKIPGWKDADAELLACQKKIEEIKIAEEAAHLERERKVELDRKEAERLNKLRKLVTIIVVAVFCLIFVLALSLKG